MTINNYLSSAYSSEMNLHIIAEDKILITKDLDIQIPKMEENKNKLLLSQAATIATLAIGILLGVSTSFALGTGVVILSIVPVCFWKIFKDKNQVIQITIDQEKRELEKIYQNMIDCVIARSRILYCFFNMVPTYCKNTTFSTKAESDVKQLDIIFEQIEKDFWINSNLVKFYQAYKRDPSGGFNSKEDIEQGLKLIELLDKCDLKMDISKVKEYTNKIAQSSLQMNIVEEKWKELKTVCHEYAQPYSSYFEMKDGKLIYTGPKPI